MSTRGERRRQARAASKAARNLRVPVTMLAGSNMVGAELPGRTYEAKPGAELDPKVPGVHRWIVTAAWKASPAVVASAFDADSLKFVDASNLLDLAIGCWDCEQPLSSDGAAVDSVCPAYSDWSDIPAPG